MQRIDRYLTAKEAGELLRVNTQTIYNFVYQQRLKKYKLKNSRAVRFKLSDVESMITVTQ